jgi:pimeloyl-ACP methyl ester carboxylesterase
LHGYGGDMGDILPSRIFLHEKYNLFFFDFRYFGKSTGEYSTAGYEEVADLNAAIQYLQKRGIHRIAIWGLSMGAAVALMEVAKHPNVRGVIAEASYARLSMMATDYFSIPLLRYPLGLLLRYWAYLYFGADMDEMTPEKASAILNLPILYMHSKADEVVPFKHNELLAKAAARNPQATFYLYDNQLHGQLPPSYEDKISHFLDSVFNKD